MSIFNWSGQSIRNLLVYLTVVMGLFCHGHLVKAQDYSWTLPDGFQWPQFDRPAPKPTDHLQFDGLILREENRVIHQIQLDRSAAKWSDQVLQVTVGYMERWSPGEYYAMLPNGYQTEPNYAVAFINSLRIKFPKKFDPESSGEMRSSNRLDYTLYRDGEHLVVAKGDERRWYFESPNGGETWRLQYIERIKSPGLYTVIEYEGELATAVRFPNGQKAVMTYENNLLSRIDTPFGESLRLNRGAGGFIKEASIFIHKSMADPRVMVAKTDDYVLENQFLYSHDAEGRMTRFETEKGVIYSIAYEHIDEIKNRAEIALYKTKVVRQSDNLYKYRQDKFLGATGERVILQGGGDNNEDSVQIKQESRFVTVNGRWSSVEYLNKTTGLQRTNNHDEFGNPVGEIVANGGAIRREYNDMGKVTSVLNSGSVSQTSYNEFGQVTHRILPNGKEWLFNYDKNARLLESIDPDGIVETYRYDNNGFVEKMQKGESEAVFEFDDWGYLTKMVHAHDIIDQWKYDSMCRMSEYASTRSKRNGELETFVYAAKYIDGKTHTISSTIVNGPKVGIEKYYFDKSGKLIRTVREDGGDTKYQYNRFGWLANKYSSNSESQIWTYHSNGNIFVYKDRERDGEYQVKYFDSNGIVIDSNNSIVRNAKQY